MRNFKLVFNYELKNQLSKKSVWVTTLVLVIIMLVATSIPRIMAAFDTSDESSQPESMGAVFENAGYAFVTDELQAEYQALMNLDPDSIYPTREALEEAVRTKKVETGFYLSAPLALETIYLDKKMDSPEDSAMADIIIQVERGKLLDAKGLSLEELRAIETLAPESKVTILGKDSLNNILVSMILLFVVYFMVLLYGNSTSVIIAREKDSKTMELLITSAKPSSLILGKVAASGVSAILQCAAIFLAALVGYKLSESFYPPMITMMLRGAMSTSYILTYLFFSLVGYILYLFLYASLGSTVSKVEDVSSATASVQFLFIAGYIISTTAMSNPGGVLVVAGSIFPFTSVMVMPIRAALATVPPAQLVIAGALLVATAALFAVLSIKIYRWGTLNYGNKKGLINALKHMYRDRRRAA